ncbi:MAG: cyclase [Pseudoalteromonas tetraodonis]|jgi:cyclase|uniref:AglZ/HisF2 family acetamidino modification protein n=1 Tax=Pseudoalteromonas TaxID=53246 RepID=UPI000C4DFCDD|nr:AglZ/HisF2 family acetamidino modification protein [Pseudoalteromonas issachenkonii]MAY60556.1 imidazole glycerol phosphate synthase subunit HisF [Pseudoalteromonas sp.]|tara:strand:+ start:554 stop:1312 length:759 start_codon:yes stop_codon:yes gene_type:complete
MLRVRVIPTLLLKNSGLVKGAQFKNHKYVGDPINAVKIFNEKEVDELVFLDISATETGKGPNFELLKDIASEAFMPFGYGGGVDNLEQIKRLFSIGVEKIIINSAAFYKPELIREASTISGNQSIVVSIDVKRSIFGKYSVYVRNGKVNTKMDPVEFAIKMQELGAGELIVCNIANEGKRIGYDNELLKVISNAVDIPVVASGGAGSLNDFADAYHKGHAASVAAGDMFVFYGKHKAVLITYPKYQELENLF